MEGGRSIIKSPALLFVYFVFTAFAMIIFTNYIAIKLEAAAAHLQVGGF